MHRCHACTELDRAKTAVGDVEHSNAVHWLSGRVNRKPPQGHLKVTD